MYMKQGSNQAAEKDYAGAYISFRKAYGYDPTNELAKSEMERMVYLQKNTLNPSTTAQITNNNPNDPRLIPTDFSRQNVILNPLVRQKMEVLQNVIHNEVEIVPVIRKLAEDLDLNVLIDAGAAASIRSKKLTINLKSVTAAKALDYIFLQENLFFQRVGPRTILVTDANRRMFYQQLVLRTFYLANAKPADVQKVIQAAIPQQLGRTVTPPLIDEATNSITVRDTSENIKIIESLIKALDKDRAEVVMDVAIYEVTKSDLLQIGNQVGTEAQLTNLGGVTRTAVTASATNTFRDAAGLLIPQTLGVGLLIPTINLIGFQRKNNTKLVASTQIHAFNNEDSSARIGQRVPVRTAQIQSGLNNNNNGFVSDVINYEQVGLTLKFKPLVFPNQDVQVTMEIESKNVAGAQTLTPTFTERTIKGTARIQNNKTLLLASVAQGSESNGRQGLPLLGLIPILGRLFTAPTKDNQQVDVVIAVTPRVIRAPAILPGDEAERPTGSQQQPTNTSLEAMVIQEAVDEQLALARASRTNADIQIQVQNEQSPVYVQSNNATTNTTQTNAATQNTQTTDENQPTVTTTNTTTTSQVTSAVQNNNLTPIDSSVRTLNIRPTADTSVQTNEENPTQTNGSILENRNAPTAELKILPTLSEMKKGEKTKLAILVRSATPFRSAVLGLKFDKNKVAVRSVSLGDVFGRELAQTSVTPFMNENGKMFVSLSSPKDTAENSSGILAYIEIEALTDGNPQIAFEGDILNFLTADGKNFTVRF
jgi:general secretion pathway protein D